MKKIKNYVCFIEIFVNILILVGITTGCWLINKKKSTEVEPEEDNSTNEDNNPTIDRWHKRYGKCFKKNRHNKHNNEN